MNGQELHTKLVDLIYRGASIFFQGNLTTPLFREWEDDPDNESLTLVYNENVGLSYKIIFTEKAFTNAQIDNGYLVMTDTEGDSLDLLIQTKYDWGETVNKAAVLKIIDKASSDLDDTYNEMMESGDYDPEDEVRGITQQESHDDTLSLYSGLKDQIKEL